MTASAVKITRKQPLPDPDRVKAAKIALIERDQTAVGWARQHGYTPAIVHKVLSGRRSCVAGESRQVAEKLGIVDREAVHG